jgi:hypothetical protein
VQLVRRRNARNAFRTRWGPQGKDILFIYSDSPTWKQYIKDNWLHRLQDRAVLLNWSERSRWRTTAPLESQVFKQFAPELGYNPLAIHIPRAGRVKTISFWQAFRDFKHGRDALLRAKEAELFALPPLQAEHTQRLG